MTQGQIQLAQTPVLGFPLLLSDNELAGILVTTSAWVRSHAREIHGFKRLGSYFRFSRLAVEEWLGGLDRLLEAEIVGQLLRVPESWVYANADEIPGVLRLGRYIRFRPALVGRFLNAGEIV